MWFDFDCMGVLCVVLYVLVCSVWRIVGLNANETIDATALRKRQLVELEDEWAMCEMATWDNDNDNNSIITNISSVIYIHTRCSPLCMLQRYYTIRYVVCAINHRSIQINLFSYKIEIQIRNENKRWILWYVCVNIYESTVACGMQSVSFKWRHKIKIKNTKYTATGNWVLYYYVYADKIPHQKEKHHVN